MRNSTAMPMNDSTPNVVRGCRGGDKSWKQQAQRLQKEVHVFYFAFKHPRVRWYARLVAACGAGYLLSPIQLIPNYIPLIGFSDDILVLFVGAKILQRIIPPEVLTECRELADAAEIRRKEETRSTPVRVAFIVIAGVWLLAAVGAGILMARYISPDKLP